MLKIRLAWLWWPRVRNVLPWLRVIWLVDLTCERHEREFCTRPFKITELEKGKWSWISNCGEAFHTDSWLAEANPGHSDWDAILKALLPGPRTVVLFGPGKARMMHACMHAKWVDVRWFERLFSLCIECVFHLLCMHCRHVFGIPAYVSRVLCTCIKCFLFVFACFEYVVSCPNMPPYVRDTFA